MGFLFGIILTVGLFIWYGRYITMKSCRAHVYLMVYQESCDSIKANLAASMITWRTCLEINESMSSHAVAVGGQPKMRQLATLLGWSG